MKLKTLIPVVALIVTALAPIAATADPYGTDCTHGTSGSYYDTDEDTTVANQGTNTAPYIYDDVQCLTVLGDGSIEHKSLVGAGLGVCSDEAGSPVPCNNPQSASSGAGAAIFDPSTWADGTSTGATTATTGNTVSAWAQLTDECVTMIGHVCGFSMLLCDDRNYDGTCTNVSDEYDQMRNAYSNLATVGSDFPNTCDSKEDKDQKDCGDDTDAESADNCFGPVAKFLQTGGVSGWNFGQIVVFLGNWVDSWPGSTGFPTNIGAGISGTTYEVWLGEVDNGCAVGQCMNDIEDDTDGGVDYRSTTDEALTPGGDAQCTSSEDASGEAAPAAPTTGTTQCSNGLDDELPVGDMLIDRRDPQCWSYTGCLVATPLCYNPTDNDESA